MSTPETGFDSYAEDYEAALDRGVSLSGESKEYFAEGRVRWVREQMDRLSAKPQCVMDFGCGIGTAVPILEASFTPRATYGIDISAESLRVARESYGSDACHFMRPEDFSPNAQIDLVYTNGTFHHILPRDRARSVEYIYRALAPGGYFALWENSPWNPGTRMVMRRVPFDRDAIMLSVLNATRLLRRQRFEIVRRDFLFVFPNALRALRPLEPYLAKFPLGAQYVVLARKPDA